MGSILIGLAFAMPILFLAHEYVIKPIANLIKDWNSPSNASTDETVTHPTISGASNASANGRVVPLVLGKSYFAPYYMGRQNNGYTYLSYSEASGTDGSKEVYTNLYILGYKDIQVRNIKMGTIPLATNDGNTWGVLPSEGYDITKKVQQDIESGELALDINSYYKPDDLKNYEMKLELKQNQQGSANEISFFNQKVIQTSYGNEMLNADGDKNPNYAFSAKYPQKIEIEIQFPQGLIDYDDEGKQAYAEVKVGLQMSLDGGSTWIPAVYFDDTYASETFTKTEVTDDRGTVSVTGFKYKKRETMRFVATVEFSNFTVADSITNKIVEFRLYRENANSTSTNCIDSVYLSKIRTWCYDTKLSREAYESGSDILIPQAPIGEKIRDKTARLGFQVLAGDEFQNSIDKINAIVTSKCYIYDEENEEWDFEHKVATDNPASLALWAMIGEHRGLYAYDIEKIDLDSFGEFYKWCAEERDFAGVVMPRFACDTVLTKQTKTSDLVNQILSCGRGSLIINGSQYGVLIDKPRTQTVHILNNQNILKRDNIKNFDEVPDGYECKFMNAMLDNEEDSIIAVPDGVEVTDDLKLQRIELPCINNPYRARAMGLYMLACAKYRPESWNVKLSTDGNLIELGNLVEIQDDTILVGIGNGGEVLQLIFDDDDTPTEIVGMITDGLFPIDDDTKEYAIKILKYYDVNGESLPVKIVKKVSREQVTANKAIFTFDDPISLNETYQPEVGDVISFGEYGKETSQSLCFSKKENGDGTFDLVLVPYDERVYTADSESADWGEFDSNVTPKQNVESTELSQAKYKGIENLQDSVSEISANVSDISEKVDELDAKASVWSSTATCDESTTSIAISSLSISSTDALRVDDTVIASSLMFHISAINETTVTVDFLFSCKGADGADGQDGADGSNGTNIWYSSAPAQTSTTSIALNTITGVTGHTIGEGDLIVANGLVFFVSAVSSSSATVVYKETVKGGNGSRAIRYLGKFATAPTTDILSGDWYLNTTTAYVYYYNANTWTPITTISDYRILSAVQDMIELYPDLTGSEAGYTVLKSVVENYVECLATGTLLANEVFSKKITAQNCEVTGSLSLNGVSFTSKSNSSIEIGDEIGSSNESGTYNLFIGKNVATKITSGSRNVGIGINALTNITTGTDNVAIGRQALYHNTTGDDNLAIGDGSLQSNTVGEYNVALGLCALQDNTIGNHNIAIGANALQASTTGDNNIAIGHSCVNLMAGGNQNVFIGGGIKQDTSSLNYQVNINNCIKHKDGVLYANTGKAGGNTNVSSPTWSQVATISDIPSVSDPFPSKAYFVTASASIASGVASFSINDIGFTVTDGIIIDLIFEKALESSSAITQVNLTAGGKTGAIAVTNGNSVPTAIRSHLYTSGRYDATKPNKVWDRFTSLTMVWYDFYDMWFIINAGEQYYESGDALYITRPSFTS